MKKKLQVPKFKSEDEERGFWSKIDLSEYYEVDDMEEVRIWVRLPLYLLERVKEEANAINVPYQSLIKEFIKKGLFAG